MPRYCVHPSGHAFVEDNINQDAFFGVHIKETLRNLTYSVLEAFGYNTHWAKTGNMDASTEKVLWNAEQITKSDSFWPRGYLTKTAIDKRRGIVTSHNYIKGDSPVGR